MCKFEPFVPMYLDLDIQANQNASNLTKSCQVKGHLKHSLNSSSKIENAKGLQN